MILFRFEVDIRSGIVGYGGIIDGCKGVLRISIGDVGCS